MLLAVLAWKMSHLPPKSSDEGQEAEEGDRPAEDPGAEPEEDDSPTPSNGDDADS